MGLSNIVFEKNKQGVGVSLPNNDHYSGMVFYADSVPTGFTSEVKEIASLAQAEGAGITTSYNSGVTHYHVSEFFRVNKNAILYVGCFTGGTSLAKIKDVQYSADGKIRQIGVYSTADFNVSAVTSLQTSALELDSESMPLSVLYQANIEDVTSLTDLTGSNANKVSVLVGQDGASTGKALYSTVGKSIGIMGAALGATSKAAVNESIAWVERFDVSGDELNELAFADGSSYRSLTSTQLGALNDKRYIFVQKHVGLNGSYFNSSFTAASNDLLSIERNRVIDKAIRNLRTSLLPRLNSPIQLTADGKLSVSTIKVLTTLANNAFLSMVSNNEVSAFSVFIDADQDVLTDDQIDISVSIVPFGVARTITIKIGFVPLIA